MNTLLYNKELIFSIINQVNNNEGIYNNTIIDNCIITDNTISIVMTSSNRSKQTYFTLETIKRSNFNFVHVILVDDSLEDPINLEELKKFPFYIDFIQINRENKKWHNPLVNYNIGFKFIKGTKVIIQNAEVCHIGNLLQYINKNLLDNNYYVFDVKASDSFDTNENIYNLNIESINIYNSFNSFNNIWYQSKDNNRCYHFLTAMTKNTFNKINNFSYDMMLSSCYDDDDFLLKIKSKNINIINLFHNIYNLGGIHLYHTLSTEKWDIQTKIEMNNILFDNKQRVLYKTGHYVDVTLDYNNYEIEYNKLKNRI
jgi:hypothetical protein